MTALCLMTAKATARSWTTALQDDDSFAGRQALQDDGTLFDDGKGNGEILEPAGFRAR